LYDYVNSLEVMEEAKVREEAHRLLKGFETTLVYAVNFEVDRLGEINNINH